MYDWHCISCLKHGGRATRHAIVVRVLSEACRSAGLYCRSEPKLPVAAPDLAELAALPDRDPAAVRADFVTFDGASEKLVDVAVFNPLCPSYANLADPFSHYDKLKQDHYRRSAPNAGPVIPFIMDCMGKLSAEASGFWKYVKGVAKKTGKRFNVRFWQSRLSVALQKANCRAMMEWSVA
jgi:hypothetical protein